MKNIIWSLKIKMNNPTFVDEETIGMVHQDEYYDDYNTQNTSKIDETEATLTLRLRQKVRRDKLNAL